MSARRGADLLCDALVAAGARCVFGLPGTQNIALFDALGRSPLRTIVATHELSASMMANGHYRASGRPGVLVTIPGPGFTFALTGLAEAALDSVALVHVVGEGARDGDPPFRLQALDQAAVAAPLTKARLRIDDAADIDAAVAAAFATALAGEPGPVLLEVARHVLDDEAPPRRAAVAAVAAPARLDETTLAAIVAAATAARRCVLFLGQGCADARDAATGLAERLGAAVVTTTSGRGCVDEAHPLSLGFELGGVGAATLNALVETADLVLAIGVKFSHNGSRGFALRIARDRLVHVDASRSVLDAGNCPARIAACADAPTALRQLLDALPAARDAAQRFDTAEIAEWRRRGRAETLAAAIEPKVAGSAEASAAAFFAALERTMPPEAVLLTDSGQHQMLARAHFRVRASRGLVVPTNLQSMGFGIGAAIGAAVAGRRAVALVGDGGLAMSGLELLAAVRDGIDLVAIVFVDHAYGMIRTQQLAASGRTFGTALPAFELEPFAASIGAAYARVGDDAEASLREVFATHGVVIVEVPLRDGADMHWMRAKGVARRLLGPALRRRLRKHR